MFQVAPDPKHVGVLMVGDRELRDRKVPNHEMVPPFSGCIQRDFLRECLLMTEILKALGCIAPGAWTFDPRAVAHGGVTDGVYRTED
jgi:hypothetical protein